jgi:hypothetical protein
MKSHYERERAGYKQQLFAKCNFNKQEFGEWGKRNIIKM